MHQTRAYAAKSATTPLVPFEIQRRGVGPTDVRIEIQYCGVCHSDIHQARNEWGGSIFPMVPGHEMVGKVVEVGKSVRNFKVGDTAGVGCMVDSCRTCASCKDGLEQYCNSTVYSYNSRERGSESITYGGYSGMIVADEAFTLKVNETKNLAAVAPLLCAGITTYSPLRHWKVGPGQQVGVVGLGGLGHMGVKLAAAMGAEVTVFTTSSSKAEDARRLGAAHVVISKDPDQMAAQSGRFHFVLNTVSAPHELTPYIQVLRREGVLVLVGAPETPPKLEAHALIGRRRSVAGSLIGGLPETQEMLDFCAERGITSDIELIPIQKINEAYERMIRNDVKYRFVIDMKSL